MPCFDGKGQSLHACIATAHHQPIQAKARGPTRRQQTGAQWWGLWCWMRRGLDAQAECRSPRRSWRQGTVRELLQNRLLQCHHCSNCRAARGWQSDAIFSFFLLQLPWLIVAFHLSFSGNKARRVLWQQSTARGVLQKWLLQSHHCDAMLSRRISLRFPLCCHLPWRCCLQATSLLWLTPVNCRLPFVVAVGCRCCCNLSLSSAWEGM